MKKMFKSIVIGVLALAIAVGATLPAAAQSIYDVNLQTGNGRMDRSLNDEERVIADFISAYSQFEDNFTSFLSEEAPSQSALQSDASAVTSANKTLQEKGFSDRIGQQYTDASVEVKSTAQDLTDLVNQVADDGVTEDGVTSTREDLQASYDTFESALQKLEAGAAAYDPPGPWLAFVLMGGVVAVIVVIIIIAVRRGAKKTAERLFGNDPAAAQLTPEQKKMLTRLASDLTGYENMLARGDMNIVNAFERSSYVPMKDKAADPSLGKYAFIIEEFTALVELKNGQTDAARAAAQKAAGIKGDNHLLTAKVRALLTPDHSQHPAS